MPYYSGGPVHAEVTGSFNEQLGGSCLQQLKKIERDLRRSGLSMHYQPSNTSVHQVGLVEEADELLLLDTSNMALDAISVSRLLDSGESVEVKAYPQCDRAKRSMEFQKISHDLIRQIITLNVVNRPPKIDEQVYDLRLQSQTPPDSMFDCLHAIQTSCIQMVAPIAGGDVATIKMDLKGNESIRRVGSPPVRCGMMLKYRGLSRKFPLFAGQI
jgi:hypothetical protein